MKNKIVIGLTNSKNYTLIKPDFNVFSKKPPSHNLKEPLLVLSGDNVHSSIYLHCRESNKIVLLSVKVSSMAENDIESLSHLQERLR